MGRRLRHRSWLALAVLALVGAVLPSTTVAALTIDAASVAFNPKKTDAFAVKGRFDPFDAIAWVWTRIQR